MVSWVPIIWKWNGFFKNFFAVNPSSTYMSCRSESTIATDDRKWGWFILASVAIYAAGIVFILLKRYLSFICIKLSHTKKENEDEEDNKVLEQSWYLCAKEVVEFTLFGQSFLGKILVIIHFVICKNIQTNSKVFSKNKNIFCNVFRRFISREIPRKQHSWISWFLKFFEKLSQNSPQEKLQPVSL